MESEVPGASVPIPSSPPGWRMPSGPRSAPSMCRARSLLCTGSTAAATGHLSPSHPWDQGGSLAAAPSYTLVCRSVLRMHGWSLIGSLGSASVLFLPPHCLVPKSVVKPVRRLGTLWGGLREDSSPENLRAEQQGKGPGAGPLPWSQQPLEGSQDAGLLALHRRTAVSSLQGWCQEVSH